MRFVENDLSCGTPIRHRNPNRTRGSLLREALLGITLFLGLSFLDTSPAIATAATAASAKKYGIDYTCVCCSSRKAQKKGKAQQGR